MPATYEKIATTTLGSATNIISFTSISSAYTDLRLVVVLKATSGATNNLNLTYNSDTGSNYSYLRLGGDGASATSAQFSNNANIRTGTGSVPISGIGFWAFDIFSYAGSTFKTTLIEQSLDANGSGTVVRACDLWRSTSAITRIDCNFSNNAEIGTTATLDGILKA